MTQQFNTNNLSIWAYTFLARAQNAKTEVLRQKWLDDAARAMVLAKSAPKCLLCDQPQLLVGVYCRDCAPKYDPLFTGGSN